MLDPDISAADALMLLSQPDLGDVVGEQVAVVQSFEVLPGLAGGDAGAEHEHELGDDRGAALSAGPSTAGSDLCRAR